MTRNSHLNKKLALLINFLSRNFSQSCSLSLHESTNPNNYSSFPISPSTFNAFISLVSSLAAYQLHPHFLPLLAQLSHTHFSFLFLWLLEYHSSTNDFFKSHTSPMLSRTQPMLSLILWNDLTPTLLYAFNDWGLETLKTK